MKKQTEKRESKAWKLWARQVNVNYHDGRMSEAEAEAAAGPEPPKYERREGRASIDRCPVCFRADDNHMFDKRHQRKQGQS